METINNKITNNKFKTIYSLKIRISLRNEGIEPLLEKNSPYKPGLKCWIYEVTDNFNKALDKILGGN